MVVKLPHPRLLKLLLVLLLLFVALFLFGNTFDFSCSSSLFAIDDGDRNFDARILPLLFHDLITSEGILRTDSKAAFLRKFHSPYIAMKRLAGMNETETETEPNLNTEKKKPDLMGDSLMSYPRRVFIDVGLPEREGGTGTGWFAKNYPTRNLDFEMYKIETVTSAAEAAVEEIGMSKWLRKNVKEEDYVVMKAEVEVVEEMMESKGIRMVDELFMECKPRGHGGIKRAYWECLALYGRLRDEGVAVHQWWG